MYSRMCVQNFCDLRVFWNVCVQKMFLNTIFKNAIRIGLFRIFIVFPPPPFPSAPPFLSFPLSPFFPMLIVSHVFLFPPSLPFSPPPPLFFFVSSPLFIVSPVFLCSISPCIPSIALTLSFPLLGYSFIFLRTLLFISSPHPCLPFPFTFLVFPVPFTLLACNSPPVSHFSIPFQFFFSFCTPPKTSSHVLFLFQLIPFVHLLFSKSCVN